MAKTHLYVDLFHFVGVQPSEEICDLSDGCAAETLAIMNFVATNCFEEDEQFLHIVNNKNDLIAASLLDNRTTSVVIDSSGSDFAFSDSIADRIQRHQMSWQEYLSAAPLPDKKFGAIFADSLEDVCELLDSFLPYCSQQFLIFVDNYENIKDDILAFVQKHNDKIPFWHLEPYGCQQVAIGFFQ